MRFVFFERFKELNKCLTDNKKVSIILNESCKMNENCLGYKQVNERIYHIFYMKNKGAFYIYYHGGGKDPIFESISLNETIVHLNKLTY